MASSTSNPTAVIALEYFVTGIALLLSLPIRAMRFTPRARLTRQSTPCSGIRKPTRRRQSPCNWSFMSSVGADGHEGRLAPSKRGRTARCLPLNKNASLRIKKPPFEGVPSTQALGPSKDLTVTWARTWRTNRRFKRPPRLLSTVIFARPATAATRVGFEAPARGASKTSRSPPST